ncbi:hypothetical protein MPSEU_000067600 [Mayamaea pseudoterrestris]|nr:hypothetical protein MPSEU_000067600 [Mayamaea pseudoterrestris]
MKTFARLATLASSFRSRDDASITITTTMAKKHPPPRPEHDNEQHSSGEGSDFFSPLSMSFFAKQSKKQLNTIEKRLRPPDSWIGVRLSPINSFDNEPHHDDDPDETHHLALHETLNAAPFVTERTSLLMGRHAQQYQHDSHDYYNSNTQSYQQQQTYQANGAIHPMWNNNSRKRIRTRVQADVLCGVRIPWGLIVCSVAGTYWLVMMLMDVLLLHHSVLNGSLQWNNTNDWSIPWLHPSQSTLVSCGALVPELVKRGSYWRVFTSSFMCTSLLELLWMMMAWRLIFLAATGLRWYRWSGLYATAVLTGQLWVMAFDDKTGVVCGCASWGTAAVLCAVGVRSPRRRFVTFVTAAVGLYMSYMMHPFGSIFGMVGGAFCGWGMASSDASVETLKAGRRIEDVNAASSLSVWASRGLTVAWTVAPVLVIATR